MRFAAIPGFLRTMRATLCFIVLKHHCQTRLTEGDVEQHTTELLERYHRITGLLILIHDDVLVFTLPDDQASGTPTEFVRAPEGVDRNEGEALHRIPSKEM
jgi:hypothetical protein